MVFDISRPKIIVGSKGSAVVGGQMIICLERLCGSPTVIVWSQGMYGCRAKTIMGCEYNGSFAGGSVAIYDGRVKVSISCVMLVGSRKIAYRYVMIGIGCSVFFCSYT